MLLPAELEQAVRASRGAQKGFTRLVSAKSMVKGSSASGATSALARGAPEAVPGRLSSAGMISTMLPEAPPPEAPPPPEAALGAPDAVAEVLLANPAAADDSAAEPGSSAAEALAWRSRSREARGLLVGLRHGATCRTSKVVMLITILR